MTDVTKYIPLKRVVAYFLDQYNKSGIYDRDRIWNLALRGYVDTYFKISAKPKTVRIPANPNGTFTLPVDYHKWSKIGVLNEKHEIATLKINTALTKWKGLHPDRESLMTPDVFTGNNLCLFPNYLNYWDGSNFCTLFGIGGGMDNIGEVTVDEINNIIIPGANYPYSDIMMEYLASPERDNDYMVEIVCQEAIISFIEWKLKLGSKRDYYDNQTEARRKLKPIQWQLINEAIRSSAGFKVKA